MNTLCSKSQRNKAGQRGFTLVELMMATAIGSLIIIGVLKVVEQAQVEGKIAALDAQVASFSAAAERYKQDTNNTCISLTAKVATGSFYVAQDVFDDKNPWGDSYKFTQHDTDTKLCMVTVVGIPTGIITRLQLRYQTLYTSSMIADQTTLKIVF